MKFNKIVPVACIAVFTGLAMLFTTACDGKSGSSSSSGAQNETEVLICDTAVDIVNDIIRGKLQVDDPATCIKVALKNKISSNEWNGVAYLDNGTEIDVVVTYKDDVVIVDMTDWLEKQVDD